MAAPGGHALAEYIHNPAGGTATRSRSCRRFRGAVGRVLVRRLDLPVLHDRRRQRLHRHAGQLPRALGSSRRGWRTGYQILYAVDERFDASGPLGGNFVNIAAEVAGDYVYLFRHRQVPRERDPRRAQAARLAGDAGRFEDLGTIVTTPGYGETSVHYYPEIGRWMLLAEESLPTSNRIVAHFAAQPGGPWSAAVTVADMGDPSFRQKYCCTTDDACDGAQMFNCDRTGFYGSYLFPSVQYAAADHTFTATYTLSSFSPYNVALFQTTFTE